LWARLGDLTCLSCFTWAVLTYPNPKATATFLNGCSRNFTGSGHSS
jgi:hypothetical protein